MGVLGLGSDFDGIHAYVGMPKADKIDHLANALHKNGFTEGQIDDIFYGNVMRVYSEVL
jgi:membrane dipeptidase